MLANPTKTALILVLMAFGAHSQLPDAGLPGGAKSGPVSICHLENIQVAVDTTPVPGERKVSVEFQFSRRPATYFHYFMKRPNRILFDFYDTKPRQLPLYVIPEQPLVSCRIETLQVDMNKDVAGLEPDFHSMTRITFLTKHEIRYNILDKKRELVFSYYWTTVKGKQKDYIVRKKSKWLLWTLLTAAIGGGAAGGYIYWENQNKKDPPTWLPEPENIVRPAPPASLP